MDANERRAILLSLVDELKEKGSWCGETHIQKAMFTLQVVTNTPIDYSFILYKHGAFSFDLRDEVTDMRAGHLLNLALNPAPYGPSLVLSEYGRNYLEKSRDTIKMFERAINFIADNLGNKGVTELERLSTALYVCKKEGASDPDVCARRVNELKPHVSIELARNAATDVSRMLKTYKEQHTYSAK